jgi:hypothetical protein
MAYCTNVAPASVTIMAAAKTRPDGASAAMASMAAQASDPQVMTAPAPKRSASLPARGAMNPPARRPAEKMAKLV